MEHRSPARRSPAWGGAVLGAVFGAHGAPTAAADPATSATTLLETVVVTAPRMRSPLTVVTDPRQPRQPLPAQDGADFLKSIPGFAVIRKGGTDGDPVFRGMAASRVNVVVDGEHVLGGCGNRMDPPTAYVFPAAFDRVVVVKGPQTVLQGPGNSAATVSFEREPRRYEQPRLAGTASALAASFARRDFAADLEAGTPEIAARLTGTHAQGDDYESGNGTAVHAAHERWSLQAAVAWTPDQATRLELRGGRSDGEAAYADRGMDGVAFDRENLGLVFEREFDPAARVGATRVQAYENDVDHLMDNYSLRDFRPMPGMPLPAASNPDRRTRGAEAEIDLRFGPRLTGTAGVAGEDNRHRTRSTMNAGLQPVESLPRVADATFRNLGVYGEFTYAAAPATRLVAGARVDDWRAEDQRSTIALGMMGSAPNPTAGEVRGRTLASGFARLERELAEGASTAYAGLGHVERFADYWELVPKESTTSLSAFDTRPERTTQLDAGFVYARGPLEVSLAGYLGDVRDYVLIETGYRKGMRTTTVARNVDARTWGGEVDFAYALRPALQLSGGLAYARGDNRTDDLALAQIPPLEARLALDYARGAWSAGALLRGVAEQDRYAVRQGNVVGQDLGRTPGFAVASLNAGWRSTRTWQVTAGVDNLFDREYAEHLSRAGADVAGYEQTSRVPEPGRTFWLQVQAGLE